MRRRGPGGLGLLLWALLAAGVPAQASVEETLQVSTRPGKGQALSEVRAQAIVDATPDSVWTVITDYETFGEQMPHVQRVQLLGTEGPRVHHLYFELDLPLVSDRDYAIRMELMEEGERKRASWTPSRRAPPEREGFVRVTRNEGAWELSPVDGGKKTKLRYRLRVDPAGALPKFIANKANEDTIPELFEAVEQHARGLDESQQASRTEDSQPEVP